MPTFFDALKSSYGTADQQRSTLAKTGYVRDDHLSSHNQQVYYHPTEKKLLYSVAGTHNLKDIGTDVLLGLGRIKQTKRYKEADETLKLAKSKYGAESATVVGNSLGGTIAGYISGENDKVVTHNKGATIGQKVRANETHYRTGGDGVSILNANSTNTFNLPQKYFNGSSVHNLYKNHLADSIKDVPIYV